MVLHDHFHPPLSVRRHWHAFHNAWATYINALLVRLQAPGVPPWEAEIYAVSYRPVQRAEQPSLDMWQAPVAVASALPTMPLWLRGHLCFPVDLDATYNRTCREQRIISNGT